MVKISKKQITELKKALKKAEKLESQAQMAAQNMAAIITDITGIEGSVDHLQGDGFGFTPISNNDTHIPVSFLIKFATEGANITEDFILDNLSI